VIAAPVVTSASWVAVACLDNAPRAGFRPGGQVLREPAGEHVEPYGHVGTGQLRDFRGGRRRNLCGGGNDWPSQHLHGQEEPTAGQAATIRHVATGGRVLAARPASESW
jgi:hypothetical protein